jgi:hypothetical protein
VSGDFYENAQLGFAYRVPQGWVLKGEGLVQPAIESYKAKVDFGRPRMGRAERVLLDACSRTLFSAWAKPPAPDGMISYDDFGEVTVSAISMACFPSLKFPKKGSDKQQFTDFVAQFALTHPIVEDMGSGEVFTENGIVFIYLHGTVAFQVPEDELSRRLSLAMAITERRGYLLTWFFAAPHDSELLSLTNERAVFDDGSAVNVATAKGSADGGQATAEPANTTAGNAAPSASPANSPASDAAAADSAAPSTGSSNPSTDQQPPGGDHPSLLRPGESMQSQQGKGVAIKPK